MMTGGIPMRVLFVGGSPKGETSVTWQYVRYAMQEFPEHDYSLIQVGNRSENKVDALCSDFFDMASAVDAVIFASPVYYCLLPSQVHRFLQAVMSSDRRGELKGKGCSLVSTSIHFFDHTAHDFLRATIEDLGMNWLESFSADMEDLLRRRGRANFKFYLSSLFGQINESQFGDPLYLKADMTEFRYEPAPPEARVAMQGKKILILSDSTGSSNLQSMVDRLITACEGQVEHVNIRDLDIRGGCLGCLQCGYDNTCVYEGKDEFTAFFDDVVINTDILILAGTVEGHFLSWKWKEFLDRTFFHNHVPSLMGKQMGYLVSGPMRSSPLIREVLQSFPSIQSGNYLGVITDEGGNSSALDAQIDGLVGRAIANSVGGYIAPQKFQAVGAQKLFRDEVWGRLRFVFRMDHKFYKNMGLYDFPQSKWKQRLKVRFMVLLRGIPPVRKDIYKNMRKHMIAPYRKLFETKD